MPKPRGSRPRAALVLLVTALLLALSTGLSSAHEDEKTVKAVDSVRQAIAYIVNDPGKLDAIRDKVHDAIEAKDISGVDLGLVKQAQVALKAGDLGTARAKLERAIGARPDLTGTDVKPIPQVPAVPQGGTPMATGDETGTTVVSESLPGRKGLTGTDWALLAIAAVLLPLGLGLARHWRPKDSVRALQRQVVLPD